MRRRHVSTRLLVAGALLALACTGDRNPLGPEPPEPPALTPDASIVGPSAACSPAAAKVILAEIVQIYRNRPLLGLEATLRFAGVVFHCTRNPALAQAQAVRLAGFTADNFQRHRLLSTVTWALVGPHVDHVYQYVGLAAPQIPVGAVTAGGAVAVVGPSDPPTTVTTTDQQAGVSIPSGAFSGTQTVLVTITPSDGTNPFPNTTNLEEFGPFYNFQTFPELPVFEDSVLVGICVDITGLPFDQAHRLQLAHPRHPDLTALELLARVSAGFLPCDSYVHAGSGSPHLAQAGGNRRDAGLARWLALFMPDELHAASLLLGGLGGKTTSFSDFRAVDPGKLVFTEQPSSTPANTSITPAVEVTLQREDGSTIPVSSTDTVKLALGENPGDDGTLSGGTERPLVFGIATFNTLAIDEPATGYTLIATDTSATGAIPQPAESDEFDITEEVGELTWTGQASGNGNHLRAVWGASGSDVFAAGYDGTILHYDGEGWTDQTGVTEQALYGVWGTSGSNVFAVGGGQGTILHYDGEGWGTQTSDDLDSLFAVWGTSGSDVFAVGYNGTILHYDGASWTSQESGTNEWLLGVWGANGGDVFAVGRNGTIRHYDGEGWSEQSSDTEEDLLGVWGTSGSDVFAVGSNGTILHYNGTSWTAQTSGTGTDLRGVWGTSGSDVYAVGGEDGGTILHYDGESWTAQTGGGANDLFGVWGASASDVFAVGDFGTVRHGSP